MIFVAGHRVTTDPVAIPFSRGVNLLCIYSKKYIDVPPEKKAEKLAHNSKTIAKLEDLLNEGGKCIYVAPAGAGIVWMRQERLISPLLTPRALNVFVAGKPVGAADLPPHVCSLDNAPAASSLDYQHRARGSPRRVSFAPARLVFGPALDMEQIGTGPPIRGSAGSSERKCSRRPFRRC